MTWIFPQNSVPIRNFCNYFISDVGFSPPSSISRRSLQKSHCDKKVQPFLYFNFCTALSRTSRQNQILPSFTHRPREGYTHRSIQVHPGVKINPISPVLLTSVMVPHDERVVKDLGSMNDCIEITPVDFPRACLKRP